MELQVVVLPRVADAGRRGAAAGQDLGQGGTGRVRGGAAEEDHITREGAPPRVLPRGRSELGTERGVAGVLLSEGTPPGSKRESRGKREWLRKKKTPRAGVGGRRRPGERCARRTGARATKTTETKF